jgi:hypothetical protein
LTAPDGRELDLGNPFTVIRAAAAVARAGILPDDAAFHLVPWLGDDLGLLDPDLWERITDEAALAAPAVTGEAKALCEALALFAGRDLVEEPERAFLSGHVVVRAQRGAVAVTRQAR